MFSFHSILMGSPLYKIISLDIKSNHIFTLSSFHKSTIKYITAKHKIKSSTKKKAASIKTLSVASQILTLSVLNNIVY